MDTVKLDEIIDEILGEILILSSSSFYEMKRELDNHGLEEHSAERAYVRLRVARKLNIDPKRFHSEKFMPEISMIKRKLR